MALRTGLWMACVVVFVAFYSFFSADTGGSTFVAGVHLVALTIGLGVFVAGFTIFYVGARRWLTHNDAGVTYLNAGQAERARAEFETALKKAINNTQTAVSRFNLGIALGVMGDVPGALKELQAVEDGKGLKVMPAYYTPLPNHLALCCALLGDLPAAKRWLKVGDDRRGNHPANFTLLPEVIVLCRDGHPAAAAHLVSTRWRDAEALNVRQFKMLKLVEAFALHADNPVTHEQRIVEALGASKPMDAFALAGLTTHWPELRDFVQSRFRVSAAA